MNPSLYIVARSTSLASESKILRSGADRVVTPNVIGGRRMATSLLNPLVADYLDITTRSGDAEYRLETLRVGDDSPFAGATLAEAHARTASGAYILSVASGGTADSAPPPDRVLNAGDELIVFGTRAQLEALAGQL